MSQLYKEMKHYYYICLLNVYDGVLHEEQKIALSLDTDNWGETVY